MTRHLFLLMAVAIIAIAVWAYGVNYKTMTTLERVSVLRGAIAKEREALQVLTVEWAFLNAPDRLSRLVKAHQDNLGLVPIASEAMKHVAAIPFPVPEFEEDPVTTPFAGGYPVPAARPVGWVTE